MTRATLKDWDSTDRERFYKISTPDLAELLYQKYLGGIFIFERTQFVLIGYCPTLSTYSRRLQFLFWCPAPPHVDRMAIIGIRDLSNPVLLLGFEGIEDPSVVCGVSLLGKFGRFLYVGGFDVAFTGNYHPSLQPHNQTKKEKAIQQFQLDKKEETLNYFIHKWSGVDLIYKTNKYSNLKGRKYKVRLVGGLKTNISGNLSFLIHFDPKDTLSSMRFDDYSNRLLYDGNIRSIKQTGYWEAGFNELIGPATIPDFIT